MLPADIRVHLIDRIAAIFGRPKNADGLADELAKHANASATIADVEALADRLIATRKTKGFPPASELIAAVKALAPSGNVAAKSGIEGELTADGPIPMTWILEEDPRWSELCRIAKALDPRRKPYPMASKHAPGLGAWWRTDQVATIPLTADERRFVTEINARARRETPKPEPAPDAAEAA